MKGMKKRANDIKKSRTEYDRARYQNRKRSMRKSHFLKSYNLTFEQIGKILLKQNHKCGICRKPLHETKRWIDHNHKTGTVRGILCVRCNLGLGMFADSTELLTEAVKYLKKGE